MANWDADTDQLRVNLVRVLSDVRSAAFQRVLPNVASARKWHQDLIDGLTPPDPRFVGRFRGEAGLTDCEVIIGNSSGVPARDVATALQAFEVKLEQTVTELDDVVPAGGELNADTLAAVLDLCAWVHAEWVRIHPFANGSGRTARLWANCIAMRYGLPPFVTLRPRPDGAYATAAAGAMEGRWSDTVLVFRQMLRETLAAESGSEVRP